MRLPWAGFTDVTFLVNAGLELMLASVLGAIALSAVDLPPER